MTTMRLAEAYRPTRLEEIVGQPHVVRPLSAFLAEPYPEAILLRGGTGVGKTSCARILADALVDPWFGEYKESGAKFDARKVDEYFGPGSPFKYKLPENRFFVLRIEEFERLPSVAENMMKDLLEEAIQRWKLVVIATSNDTSRLETALLHRFKVFDFDSGPKFAAAFRDWLGVVWPIECGGPLPAESGLWGLLGDGTFSARLALDEAQGWLMSRTVSEQEEARVLA
jgi:replication-associated recombination protein RarA